MGQGWGRGRGWGGERVSSRSKDQHPPHEAGALAVREPVSHSCWEEGKKQREDKDGKEKSVHVDLCDSLRRSTSALYLSLSFAPSLYESVSSSLSLSLSVSRALFASYPLFPGCVHMHLQLGQIPSPLCNHRY